MSMVILRERMSQDLRTAMKNRDKATVSLLRTLMATLDNAEAIPVDQSTLPKIPTTERYEAPRRELSADEIAALLQREVTTRQETHAEFLRLGLTEDAARLQTEIALITQYV